MLNTSQKWSQIISRVKVNVFIYLFIYFNYIVSKQLITTMTFENKTVSKAIGNSSYE